LQIAARQWNVGSADFAAFQIFAGFVTDIGFVPDQSRQPFRVRQMALTYGLAQRASPQWRKG
jgi:hypothetical protein